MTYNLLPRPSLCVYTNTARHLLSALRSDKFVNTFNHLHFIRLTYFHTFVKVINYLSTFIPELLSYARPGWMVGVEMCKRESIYM